MEIPKRVLIIGGGFAGLNLAKDLCDSDFQVTLIDKRNHHLFQPLLYQVATAGLSPAEITMPLRRILSACNNTEVIFAELSWIDAAEKRVHLTEGGTIDYDFLVLATGSVPSYFRNDSWEQYAPSLKSIEEAVEFRKRILVAFEEAESDRAQGKGVEDLQFIVIGGGPTGVELAGAIAELASTTLPQDYRRIDTRQTRVILLEGGPRLLPSFDAKLSEKARQSLEVLGVQVHLEAMVVDVQKNTIALKDGRQFRHTAAFWAAGIRASPVAQWLNAPSDQSGRVIVDEYLRPRGIENVFVIGDAAHFEVNGKALAAVAPVAIQQGKYLAQYLKGKSKSPFRYRDKGNLATIGRNKAVAEMGRLKISGFFAWILWAVIHIIYLIGFKNRVFVIFQWLWAYIAFQRGARLITYSKGKKSQDSESSAP